MAGHSVDIDGLSVSRETAERLEHFTALFQKWARTINLVAPSTLGDMWNRHIRDSVQIYTLSPGPLKWVDLGSGGGFPGVVTAILLNEAGGGHVEHVESNHKKAAFLRTALMETGGLGTVHACRIEQASRKIGNVDAISARALAELSKLLEFVAPWMDENPKARAFFHKGRDYVLEIEKARSEWAFDLITHKSVVEENSYVLEISNLVKLIK
ncbi:MAG: 16S rRNA (guanine(527)-N(7))-methyltransferase RsmG [Gammaproteobacteria bacterium]